MHLILTGLHLCPRYHFAGAVPLYIFKIDSRENYAKLLYTGIIQIHAVQLSATHKRHLYRGNYCIVSTLTLAANLDYTY